MIGYALSHRNKIQARASARGPGAVMLAFDELDLEGGDERLGDGVIQARPNATHGDGAAPARSQTSTQAAELNSLPRSVKTASTSATTPWQGELWGGGGPGGCRVGEHSEGELLSVAVVARSCRDRLARMRPAAAAPVASVNADLDR
jgi:hypothetical protein